MRILNGLLFRENSFEKGDLCTDAERFAPQSDTAETLDAAGCLVIPGLVDVHTHGCAGFDFADAGTEALRQMDQWYLRHGVTSVAATVITSPQGQTLQALRQIADYIAQNPGGAICASRAEGPFLSREYAGAHDVRLLRQPDLAYAEEMLAASNGTLRILDLDPCGTGAEALIRALAPRLHISLAHTPCTEAEALRAWDAGARGITHLFNAMAPIHHRAPAMLGAFAEGGFIAELICDGVHVHPSLLKLLFRYDAERICVISDSVAGCGTETGEFLLGNSPVHMKNGRAYDAQGHLAGSVCPVSEGLKNLVRAGVPAEAAIASATRIPAALLKRKDIGTLRSGAFADAAVLSPQLEVLHVIKHGKLLF